MFSTYIHLPTPPEARANMEKWRQHSSIPGIVGALDGTHIAISKPCEYGQDYYNRKGYYSINVQGSTFIPATNEALVDYKKRFLDVEIGWPGSVGDSRIFDNSYLSTRYEEVLAHLGTTALATGDNIVESVPAFILGDSAYRNSRHLVTTYRVTECNADPSIRHLNYRLSKARYKVENAFGLLKGRFQIFQKPLRSAAEDLPFTIHLIASICILHNFLIDVQDEMAQEEIPVELEERLQRGTANDDDNDEDQPEGQEHEREYEHEHEEGGALATRQVFLRYQRWLDAME